MAETWRATQKADRRARYLDAAARLFAERGFNGVSIDDLGEAAGVSGPALYRHFASKDAVLRELLVDASERLVAAGERIIAEAEDPAAALDGLVRFHLDFALAERDVIRIQDRELASLPAEANHAVRALQRRYVEAWIAVLRGLRPELETGEAEIRVLAGFGLLNSTPFSAPDRELETAREVLARMTSAALLGA